MTFNQTKSGQAKPATVRSHRALVLTKLKGVNIGNQALTLELAEALQSVAPEWSFHYAGRSSGLNEYTIARLLASGELTATFDQWARRIADVVTRHGPREVAGWSDNTSDLDDRVMVFDAKGGGTRGTVRTNIAPIDRLLNPTQNLPLRQARILVNRHLRGAASFKKRLSLIAAADALVYNGAGEVSVHDLFLHQMLQLRAGQILGVEVVPTNQSIQVQDRPLLELVSHIYKEAPRVIVRGQPSKERLASAGVPDSKIEVAPDLAFRSPQPSTSEIARATSEAGIEPGAVGLCLSGPIANHEHWDRVLDELRSLGRQVVFVTNAPYPDLQNAARLQAAHEITVAPEYADYRRYSAMLGGLDFIISTRLHTCVLGNVSGVPVIPIDTETRKLSESYDELSGYPFKTVDPGAPGWLDLLLQQVEMADNAPERVRAATAEATADAADRSLANVSWLMPQPA